MFAGCSWPTIVVENLKSEEITELSLILSLSNEKEIIMMMVMMIMNDGEFIKLCCHCYISNIGHVKTKGTSKTQGFCLGPLQPLPTIHSNRVIFIYSSMTEGKIVILFLWQVCLSWGVVLVPNWYFLKQVSHILLILEYILFLVFDVHQLFFPITSSN